MQIEIRRPEEVDTPVATWWIIFSVIAHAASRAR
jgi:hypothetical protein